jgi:hypothetical protein
MRHTVSVVLVAILSVTVRAAEVAPPAADALEAFYKEQAAKAASSKVTLRAGGNRTFVAAGRLGMALERTGSGVALRSLRDLEAGQEFLTARPLPLFAVKCRRVGAKDEVTLAADAGWEEVVQRDAGDVSIEWKQPADKALAGISASARVEFSGPEAGASWTLRVSNGSKDWTLWSVTFPQIAVAEPGPEARLLFPRGPGEVKQGAWRKPFGYGGPYPQGWTGMQFFAAYDEKRGTALYVGVHDPTAARKDLAANSKPDERAVTIKCDHPPENMSVAGNSFDMAGRAVWRIFRGDWYDAAVIYRDWVRKEARWMPPLSEDGRQDTAPWMRQLCLWAQTGGDPQSVGPRVKEFARYMGMPVGFHWYSWHEIPFDNDYPHYFPARKGFAEAVRDMQASGVYVMPYINARLWDTRDKAAEDFEFTRVALPGATKDEQGKPCTETYGSKEADGSPVRLAAMCSTSPIWQDRVRGIVLALLKDYGTSAVYMDQVAAAHPPLCFDKTHGHPLGGGQWWVGGYGRMLRSIRQAMPKDRMLTTECNAEPYVNLFDGYLTWHWQFDGQVPAFPAVYGGTIQMFGRAYNGLNLPTGDLALAMRVGQQFVFGEQFGWLDPDVVRSKERADFLRQAARVRLALVRYFYAGEMARPARLVGDIPRVRADWRWSNEWWVSTDAVMTGTWRLPQEKKLAVLFANVGDKPVSLAVQFDGAAYGVNKDSVAVTPVEESGRGRAFAEKRSFQRTVEFAPRKAWAWEISY